MLALSNLALGLLAAAAGLCRTALASPAPAPAPATGPVPSPENPAVEIVYQFPPTMAPENEFLRSNGQLLVTCLTCNILSQIDPNLGPTQQRRTVFAFPDGVVNVLGIDELTPDVFAVAVGQVDLKKDAAAINTTDPAALALQGPTGVWVVDLRRYQAPTWDSSLVSARKVGGPNLGGLYDGVAVINGAKGLVAVTDFVEGNVWLVDISRATTSVIVEKLALPPSNGQPSSLALANGLKYRAGRLFFTGTVTGTYASVPVDANTGRPTGPVQVLYDYGFALDDLGFGPTGNVYFTTFAKPNGGVIKRPAGTPNGVDGSSMPVSYFATNSIIPRDVPGGKCELIMTVFLQFQVVKATIPGPC